MNHVPEEQTKMNYEHATKKAQDEAAPVELTMENVHTLSTFQLRQVCKDKGIELEETGALQDWMIKTLVSLMVAERRAEEKAAFEQMQADDAKKKVVREEEKEARKAAAKERSRVRREAEAAAQAKFEAEAAEAAEAAAAAGPAEPEPEPEPEEAAAAGAEEDDDEDDDAKPAPPPEMTPEFRSWFGKVLKLRATWSKDVQTKAGTLALVAAAKRPEHFAQADTDQDEALILAEYIDYTKLEYAFFCASTGCKQAYDRKMMLLHREGFNAHPKTAAGGERIALEDIVLMNQVRTRAARRCLRGGPPLLAWMGQF
jgi:hypothetical protein